MSLDLLCVEILDVDVNLLISVLVYRWNKSMMENRILKLQQDLVIRRCRGRLTWATAAPKGATKRVSGVIISKRGLHIDKVFWQVFKMRFVYPVKDVTFRLANKTCLPYSIKLTQLIEAKFPVIRWLAMRSFQDETNLVRYLIHCPSEQDGPLLPTHRHCSLCPEK